MGEKLKHSIWNRCWNKLKVLLDLVVDRRWPHHRLAAHGLLQPLADPSPAPGLRHDQAAATVPPRQGQLRRPLPKDEIFCGGYAKFCAVRSRLYWSRASQIHSVTQFSASNFSRHLQDLQTFPPLQAQNCSYFRSLKLVFKTFHDCLWCCNQNYAFFAANHHFLDQPW